jgi:hypothetical protein
MADKPCNTCANYDPIVRGRIRVAKHGRCIPRSTYPAKEQHGQSFPPGCARAEPGELAKPHIVVGSNIVRACELYRAKIQIKQPYKPKK